MHGNECCSLGQGWQEETESQLAERGETGTTGQGAKWRGGESIREWIEEKASM